jgi:hypothetical protein
MSKRCGQSRTEIPAGSLGNERPSAGRVEYHFNAVESPILLETHQRRNHSR